MRSEQDRAGLRDLVRRGYDAISRSYRNDLGDAPEIAGTYSAWIADLTALLRPHAQVLDLGCGAGVPAARDLVAAGCRVTGVDISSVQVARARQLVPQAEFIEADMTMWDAAPGSFDAIVCLYALIHLPLEDQRRLIPRLRRWLADSGYLLAIVGAERWTGVGTYLGTEMFWEHEEPATYLEWLQAAGLEPQWSAFVPEGAVGHTLVLARAV